MEEKKCACGRDLFYLFEKESGICEQCELEIIYRKEKKTKKKSNKQDNMDKKNDNEK